MLLFEGNITTANRQHYEQKIILKFITYEFRLYCYLDFHSKYDIFIQKYISTKTSITIL